MNYVAISINQSIRKCTKRLLNNINQKHSDIANLTEMYDLLQYCHLASNIKSLLSH